MESDEGLLIEILKKMLGASSAGPARAQASPGLELERVDADSPHGIYRYDKGKDRWILAQVDGEPFAGMKDGYHVIYFDNSRCPACRVYDIYWYPFVKLIGSAYNGVDYWVALCNWFARDCQSPAASKAFSKFDIHASPTTVMLKVAGGSIERKEKHEGVKRMDELAKLLDSFISGRGPT